nr:hypothetical protein Iba_chr01bCG3870 [Ipomoea batatas]
METGAATYSPAAPHCRRASRFADAVAVYQRRRYHRGRPLLCFCLTEGRSPPPSSTERNSPAIALHRRHSARAAVRRSSGSRAMPSLLPMPENRGRCLPSFYLAGSRRRGCHCRTPPAPLHSMSRRWEISRCRWSRSLEGHRLELIVVAAGCRESSVVAFVGIIEGYSSPTANLSLHERFKLNLFISWHVVLLFIPDRVMEYLEGKKQQNME